MLVEYAGKKFSRVRWQAGQIQSNKDSVFVAGTWDGGPDNKLTVWSLDSTNSQTGVEFVCHHEVGIPGDVTQICTFEQSFVSAVTAKGNLNLYSLPEKELSPIRELTIGDKPAINDIAYSELSRELIACDADGNVSFFQVETGESKTSIPLSKTSIECLDIMSGHQIICGNAAGHLKLLDTRQQSASLSLAGTLSAVLSVKRNPSNNHIVASGNDLGKVCLWDLRQPAQPLLQLAAHSSSVTDMYYDQKEVDAFYSSSNDGQLLKWCIEPNLAIRRVDCIVGKAGGHSISSFHVNYNNEFLYAADNEVIGFGQL